MAVNNALRRDEDCDDGGVEGETTVLTKGTVEARGYGVRTDASGGEDPIAGGREEVDKEIREFLNGEGAFGPRAECRAFFTVWTFITRLPGPAWVDHHPGYLMRGMAYFPFAGLLVGAWCSVFFDVARDTLLLPASVCASLSSAASFWITGCFHEDGLADASDGIGGGWSRTQILRIMSDTRLGTYGCAVLLLYLVTKLQLLSSLGSSEWELFACRGAGPALLVAHTLARWTAPFLIHRNDYVDEGGPKYKYYSFMLQAKHLVTTERLAFASLTSASVVILCYGGSPWVLLLGGSLLLFALGSERYANYLLGGVMGDYLGATICVAELVVLMVILARPSIEGWSSILVSWRACDLPMVLESRSAFSLLKALLVLGSTIAWCSFVGPPNVFQRESKSSAAAAAKDKKKKRDLTKFESPVRANGRETKEDAALRSILESKETSFREKFEAMMGKIDGLCKPPGSLGTLEMWCAQLGALQGTPFPSVANPLCIVYAGDHGVARPVSEGGEGASAFSQQVTRKILNGLGSGSLAVQQLTRANQVDLRVLDVGVTGLEKAKTAGGFQAARFRLPRGTRNFCKERAMTAEEVAELMEVGREEARAASGSHGVICLGEIGIGNTTTSSALLCALTGASPEKCCGGGATLGRQVDAKRVELKRQIVEKALRHHNLEGSESAQRLPVMEVLSKCGGAEICALAGTMVEAGDLGIPVLVDGFIVAVAALVAARVDPAATRVMFFADAVGTEMGQAVAVGAIARIAEEAGFPVPSPPALTVRARLGEAAAAVVAVPLLRSAAAIARMGSLQSVL